MKGIRKRVLVSFFSVGGLLLFAGMVSFFELNHVSTDTEEILRTGDRNLELAKDMLDAVNRQNTAVLRSAVLGQRPFEGIFRESMERLDASVASAREAAYDGAALDSLDAAAEAVRGVTDDFFRRRQLRIAGDSLRNVAARLSFVQPERVGSDPSKSAVDGVVWYETVYEPVYARLTEALRNYILSTQDDLAPRTEQLRRNAYRSVTPVLISLLVMILIVLMLCYFVMVYVVSPIVAMNASLGEWIRFRLPFRVKAECRDEVQELKTKVEELIRMASNVKPE